jgi:Na+-driven multidrug efflux pump
MVALWAVGVTLGTSLAFATSLRAEGIWIGLMGGVIASGSTLAVMVSRVNWRNEAELAKQSAVNVHNIDDEQEEKVAAV